MPRIGGRKLLYKMEDRLPQELQFGRDLFFDFLREYGLLVRKSDIGQKQLFQIIVGNILTDKGFYSGWATSTMGKV